VNTILASLLFRFTAEDLRLVLIDPKMVEMQHYNALPHLIVPVVTEAKKVPLALGWVIREMEKRFQIFAKSGVRNITAFNTREKKSIKPEVETLDELDAEIMAKEKPEYTTNSKPTPKAEQELLKIEVPRDFELIIPDKLPYVVVVVDELADLMTTVGKDVEMAISRLTALGRAAGIHLVVATQRPSVNVVTESSRRTSRRASRFRSHRCRIRASSSTARARRSCSGRVNVVRAGFRQGRARTGCAGARQRDYPNCGFHWCSGQAELSKSWRRSYSGMSICPMAKPAKRTRSCSSSASR